MFKKENRLAPDVIFKNSFSMSVPQFVLKEKKNGLGLNRFGIVVSKKIDKRAVTRNKVKRFFRTLLIDMSRNLNPGHDILFITRKTILERTKEENEATVKEALKKAGLIRIND